MQNVASSLRDSTLQWRHSVINRVANRCSKRAGMVLVLTTLRSTHFTLIEASLQWTCPYNSQ